MMVPGSPLGGARLAGSPPPLSFSLILARAHSTTKGDQEAAVHPSGEPTGTPLSPLVHPGLPVKHGPGKPEGSPSAHCPFPGPDGHPTWHPLPSAVHAP